MNRSKRLKLRTMLLKWQKTKDLSIAHDICEHLVKNMPKPVPVTYIPTEYKIEVKYGRN